MSPSLQQSNAPHPADDPAAGWFTTREGASTVVDDAHRRAQRRVVGLVALAAAGALVIGITVGLTGQDPSPSSASGPLASGSAGSSPLASAPASSATPASGAAGSGSAGSGLPGATAPTVGPGQGPSGGKSSGATSDGGAGTWGGTGTDGGTDTNDDPGSPGDDDPNGAGGDPGGTNDQPAVVHASISVLAPAKKFLVQNGKALALNATASLPDGSQVPAGDIRWTVTRSPGAVPVLQKSGGLVWIPGILLTVGSYTIRVEVTTPGVEGSATRTVYVQPAPTLLPPQPKPTPQVSLGADDLKPAKP